MTDPPENTSDAWMWRRPLWTQTLELDGKRFTKFVLIAGTEPQRYPTDVSFKAIKDEPQMLLDPFTWHVIMPWLVNSPDDLTKFWEAFIDPKARMERARALYGTSVLNRQKERALIAMARVLHDAEDPHVLPLLSRNLAEWVVNAVVVDHEAPKRLYELLRAKEKPLPPEKNAKYLRAFAEALATDERLPTKKKVRKKMGPHEKISFSSRTFKTLGLQGLPHG